MQKLVSLKVIQVREVREVWKAKIHLFLKMIELFLMIIMLLKDLVLVNFLKGFATQLMKISQDLNELFSFLLKDLLMNKFHLPYSKLSIQINYGSVIHIL